jgi:hypothetical protein
VSESGKRAETLFLVDGRFRTRREAGLTYRSQSMGELDQLLERKRKIEARLRYFDTQRDRWSAPFL